MTGQIELSSPFSSLEYYEIDTANLMTVQDHFDLLDMPNVPIVCSFNGKPLLRKDWNTIVKSTDLVKFIVLPQGGGSGGVKGILRIVIMIVIMIFAWYVAPILAPILGMSANVIAAGVVLIGSVVVSLVLPPVTPDNNNNGPQNNTADPTYNIAAQGNVARLLEPISKLYGKHILYPDYASQPWIEYINNDQYLYQLFCLGLGRYNVHQIRIEDTVLWDEYTGLSDTFSDVELEIVEPGNTISLFPAAVVSATEVVGQSFEVKDEYIGPFIVNASGTLTNKIGIDIVFSRGIYLVNNQGGLRPLTISMAYEARAVDTLGNPIGDWIDLGTFDYTGATATAQRYSETFTVSPGRYEVRVKRTTDYFTDTKYGNQVQWAGLRAYIPDDNIFNEVTILAVKMRATNQLSNQSSRKFNTIQTSLVPIYNGSEWVDNQPSQNPVWHALDVLRNQTYGMRMPDSRLDLTAFLSLAQTLDSRGDTFNGIFSAKESVWDVLSSILKVGRAQPLMVGGVVSVTRDEPALITRGMFTPANIVQNSFESTYVLYDEDSPDSIIVEFFDERTWKRNEVLCQIPGSTTEKPARISLFGCTQRTQAWKEGMYQAACNLYRRIITTITVEMEGRLLLRGDAAVISHDLPSWGESALVMGWNSTSRILSITEPTNASPGDVVGLSDRQGKLWGPVEISNVLDDGYQIQLDLTSYNATISAMGPIPVYFDFDADHTRIAIGTLSDYTKAFKLIAAVPNDMETLNLTFINDDPRVYEVDNLEPPEELSPYGPGVIPSAPVMTGLYVNQDPASAANPVLLNASWAQAPGADYYIIQTSPDAVTWATVYEGLDNRCVFTAVTGPLYIRGAAIGILQGPWAYPDPTPVNYSTPDAYPTQPQELTVTLDSGDIVINWITGLRTDDFTVNLYSDSVTPDTYDQLEMTETDITAETFTFLSADITSAGGPWTDFMIEVIGNNDTGAGPEITKIYLGA